MQIDNRKLRILIVWLAGLALLVSCGPKDTKWKGQGPIQVVDTHTRPIEFQLKSTFEVDKGIFFSNDFDGARLNGLALTDSDEISVLITPENTPINASPWYAFKVWSTKDRKITLKLTYNNGVSHRYYPKVSKDGKTWAPVDSAVYRVDSVSLQKGESPKFCEMDLSLSSDTLWIAAQELIVSKNINKWGADLAELPFVTQTKLGESKEGRPMNMLEIGDSSDKLVIILSRQHPPEVTGWLAMKAFVERVCAEDELAKKFLSEYKVYVIPCVNPDGVDRGNWRHNAGGIDLNRDWESFNQPETQQIRKFMQDRVIKGDKFYASIDFHSTWEDIYYTIAPELQGNMPGLIPKVIEGMAKDIPGYDPNIRPGTADAPKISSTSSIFNAFHAEAMTYEVGDDTPRDLIKKKGEFTAENLMELMLEDQQ